jgi:UTP--glucose-1-phosphate uridylyltransferase
MSKSYTGEGFLRYDSGMANAGETRSKTVIRKAVFPAAGLGTRFLPATKAQPKEMLPLVDKPIIQYGVEEALASGVDNIILVTGRGKNAIEDHFDVSVELETFLEARGKTELLAEIRKISNLINFSYVRQGEPLGLGHAVLVTRALVGDEPFAVILADDLIDADVPVTKQMVDIATRENVSTIGVMEVPADDIGSWGIVETAGAEGRDNVSRITRIVEKPKPGTSPSTLAVVGRYVLTPAIFAHLRAIGAGAGGEIQLTDGIARLMGEERVVAYRFEGRRYDCGRKLGYLEATVALGLKHPETGEGFARFLAGLK